MPTNAALDFFTWTVKPTVDEFLNDTYDIRRGRLAAIVLFHMADYWCWHLHNGGKKLNCVYKDLHAKCPDFALIRNIANASKHYQLTRGARRLSSSEQITRPPGLFTAPFGEGVFAEASNVILRLDDGTERLLEEPIRSVLTMWESLIS